MPAPRSAIAAAPAGARARRRPTRRSTPEATLTLVLTLLLHGCPIPAIVAAFGLDERTVRA